MADSLYSLGNHSELAVTAFDRNSELAFQPRLIFSQFAEKKAWNGQGVPEKGSSVTFTIHDALNPSLDVLPESGDPDSVNFDNLQKNVSMNEQGGLVKLTSKIKLASWDKNAEVVSRNVGLNMAQSVDLLARKSMDAQAGADYVRFVGATSKVTVASDDTMAKTELDIARAVLDSRNVMGIQANPDAKMTNSGGMEEMVVIMHPNVYFNLFTQTDGLVGVAKYANPTSYYNGELGTYNGMRILVTTNAEVDYNSGVAVATSDIDGAVAVAGTSLTVTAGTDFTGTGTVTITTDGSDYTYKVTAKATHVLTIDKIIDIDGIRQVAKTGSGFVAIHADTDVVTEGVDVYTTYVMGYQALAYAYQESANLVMNDGLD